jgi:MFS family permease
MHDPSRPTRVRYVVVLVTTLVAVLLYLDRFCLSFAETFIAEDLSLSRTQVGWLLSAFFWSYAIVQVPSGWLTDRLGGRLTLTLYVLAWSLFTGWTGLAIGFVSLFVLRLGVGAGQAGAYPTAASLVSRWMPFSQRGTASSIIALGGRVGGAMAPLLTAYLIAALVPASVSSEVGPGDWLNPASFCRQLASASVSPDTAGAEEIADPQGPVGAKQRKELATAAVSRRVVASFSAEGRAMLARVGTKYDDALRQARAIAKDEKAEPTPPALAALVDPQEMQLLSDELNRVVNDAAFYKPGLFAEFPLPKEAERYRADIKAGRALPPDRLARLNRLLLEAVYPSQIRKVHGAGWRPVMLLFGAVGLLVAGLYWLCLRNRPQDHPRCNEAERELIAAGRPAEVARIDGQGDQALLNGLVRNGNLWLANVSMFFTNVGWVFLVSWMPRYFEEVHYVPLEIRGWIGFIPLAAGTLPMLFGGWLTDALVRRIGLRWGRALPMGLSRFAAMAAYLYCLTHPQSYWSVVAALAAVAVFTDLGIGAIWAYMQDIGGRNVASVLGWTNMWGNFGAAVGPVVVGWLASDWLVGAEYQWDAAFVICAASFGISGLTALAVDARRPALGPAAVVTATAAD